MSPEIGVSPVLRSVYVYTTGRGAWPLVTFADTVRVVSGVVTSVPSVLVTLAEWSAGGVSWRMPATSALTTASTTPGLSATVHGTGGNPVRLVSAGRLSPVLRTTRWPVAVPSGAGSVSV